MGVLGGRGPGLKPKFKWGINLSQFLALRTNEGLARQIQGSNQGPNRSPWGGGGDLSGVSIPISFWVGLKLNVKKILN